VLGDFNPKIMFRGTQALSCNVRGFPHEIVAQLSINVGAERHLQLLIFE
jgi:hypothetical protein